MPHVSPEGSPGDAFDTPPPAARPGAVLCAANLPLAICLCTITLATFLPAVRCGFVNLDDEQYVRHPLVLGGLSSAGIRGSFTEVIFHNWAPLTILSYALDTTLFGPGPWGYHLTNVVLHAAAVTMLFLAFARMTGRPALAAAAMLLFAVHPLRVESVAWVAERKDVLCMAFLALALLAYERYCRRPTPARYLVVVAAMLGGLLSKATIVALPMLLVVLDVWPLGRVGLPGLKAATRAANQPTRHAPASWRLACGEKLPLLGLSALFVAVTIATQAETIHAETSLPLVSARVPNAIVATATYLVETVWPVGLHPVHPHPGPDGHRPAAVLASCLGLLALVAIGMAVARRVPAVPAGIAWFFIALSPMLGLVKQHGFQARADRFTYLAHVGLFVAIIWACARLADAVALPRWWRLAAVATVAVWFIAIDQRQMALWRNPDTLWSGVLVIDPDNHVAIAKQALGRLDRGDLAGAERGFRRTLALAPHFPEAHYNLGVTFVRQQRYEEAIEAFRAAIRDDPRDAAARANLGGCHARAGRWEEAITELRVAVGLDGRLVSARLNLAACLLETNAAAEALRQARAVLASEPDNAAARQLVANCLSALGTPPQ